MAASRNVRRYVRAAERRLEDAQFLHDSGDRLRQTGAVYLAGYAAECGLKALMLSRVRGADQPPAVYTHSLQALRDACESGPGGVNFPRDEFRAIGDLARVWDTGMRYNPGETDTRDAAAFLRASATILSFAVRSL